MVITVNWRTFYVLLTYFFLVTSEGSSIERKKRGVGGSWGYTSRNGPSTWGGICQTGRRQSPINIQLGKVIVKNYPSFKFEGDYVNKHKFHGKNNGHTIYVAPEEDIQAVVYGGGLGERFVFEQLHFHWESEHEFEGKRADLEMHLVHYNEKYGSFEEASTKPDGIAVFAVLFDESKQTDHLIENFFENILDSATLSDHMGHPPVGVPDNSLPRLDEDLGKESHELFALRDLLPKYTSRFFRYEGSLTTPGCGEVVQWTVFINRLPVSSNVLESVKKLRDHDGNVLDKNFRPPQKLNGREVFIQIVNYDGRPADENGQLNGATPNSFLSIYVLFSCLIIHLRFK